MTKNEEVLAALKGNLIVSCQALPDEPLHSSEFMGKMAVAALQGGAKGIRANSVEDIKAIKECVKLPIIGIIKKVYDQSDVFITPTIVEVEALVEEGVDIIALDATRRLRPDGHVLSDVFPSIRAKYPHQLFMADCSNYEEAKEAYDLGFDCLGTTLSGYTSYTKGTQLPDVQLIERLVKDFPIPVIAEGGIWTPEDLKHVFDLGVHTAVVGTAITRPREITKRFVNAIQ